jgi:phospholipid/cholesterol/gamma-HCH transport system ATP-binding protein
LENETELAIDIQDVSMSFNDVDFVLSDINLKIPKGKITAIIGYSGAGKSVLLKLILGLLKPTKGSIKVLNEEITTMDSRHLQKLHRHYGMLFQDSALFDDLNVIENVKFPIIEHRKDLSAAQITEIAIARLNDAGLEEVHFQKKTSDLSGGMKKRVALARALALDPDILIYDEPTSIVVTHDLHGAFYMANYVIMLEEGKILLHGTPTDFLKSEDEKVQVFISKGLHQIDKNFVNLS